MHKQTKQYWGVKRIVEAAIEQSTLEDLVLGKEVTVTPHQGLGEVRKKVRLTTPELRVLYAKKAIELYFGQGKTGLAEEFGIWAVYEFKKDGLSNAAVQLEDYLEELLREKGTNSDGGSETFRWPSDEDAHVRQYIENYGSIKCYRF